MVIAASAAMLQWAACAAAGERTAFNEGWRFFRGEASGGESPGFNDDQWQKLRLPHDWAIECPFDSAQNPQTAALPISVAASGDGLAAGQVEIVAQAMTPKQ
jgi:beta-galactosidase